MSSPPWPLLSHCYSDGCALSDDFSSLSAQPLAHCAAAEVSPDAKEHREEAALAPKKKGASVWGVKAPFGACHGAGWWRALYVERQISTACSNAKIRGEMPAWSISPLPTPADAQDGISDKSYIRRVRHARNSTLISHLRTNRSQAGAVGVQRADMNMAARFVVPSYDIWKHLEAVAATLFERVGAARILGQVFRFPPNSGSVLDEKRPTKKQEAQRNDFHDVPCDPSLLHQWLHAVLPLGSRPRRTRQYCTAACVNWAKPLVSPETGIPQTAKLNLLGHAEHKPARLGSMVSLSATERGLGRGVA